MLWSKKVLTLLVLTHRNNADGCLGHGQCVVNQSVFFQNKTNISFAWNSLSGLNGVPHVGQFYEWLWQVLQGLLVSKQFLLVSQVGGSHYPGPHECELTAPTPCTGFPTGGPCPPLTWPRGVLPSRILGTTLFQFQVLYWESSSTFLSSIWFAALTFFLGKQGSSFPWIH